MKTRGLSLAYLESLPTLSQGQADDLKIKTKDTRVWLSRMTKEDEMPYDNQVTVEKLYPAMYRRKGDAIKHGAYWATEYTYQAL